MNDVQSSAFGTEKWFKLMWSSANEKSVTIGHTQHKCGNGLLSRTFNLFLFVVRQHFAVLK